MSFRYLELVANLEMPDDWTILDRLVFVWHCNRYDEKKGKAWPSENELVTVTGVNAKSVSRSRGRLVKSGALYRVTKACEGRRAEYAVIETWLLSNQRVTDELPVKSSGLQNYTQKVTVDDLKGNASALNGLPDSNPKLIKPNQLNKRTPFLINDLRFQELVVNNLPHALRSKITNGLELDSELSALLEAGYSDQQIKDKLNIEKQWQGVRTPYYFVRQFLSALWVENPVMRRSLKPVEASPDNRPTEMPPEIRKQMEKLFKKPE